MDYHKNQFEDSSLLVFKKNKLIALFPANHNKDIVYSHQGLTYGGLLTSEMVKLIDVIECFKVILLFYKSIGYSAVEIKLLPSIYSIEPNDEMQYMLFILKANLIRRDTLSSINLKHRFKISKDRVDGRKRALKHNLEIKEVDDLSQFWNQVLIPNLKNKHNTQPVHSLEEITHLKQKFPNNIRQFNVYLDDNIVAGTTIFETKFVAHSQYISGSEKKNELGSLDFLHLHLIDNVFSDKRYFDFGTSNEQQGKHINKGLMFWKERFGARTIIQDFYSINLENMNNLDTIFV
jgi:hypothetical protein